MKNETDKAEAPAGTAATSEAGMSRCATCGHKWETETSGEHSCTDQLREQVKNLEAASHELEARLIWALKYMKCPGDGIMVSQTADGKFSKGIHWSTWFADGLELLGRYKVDRELLGLSRKERDKILKARAANHQNKENA